MILVRQRVHFLQVDYAAVELLLRYVVDAVSNLPARREIVSILRAKRRLLHTHVSASDAVLHGVRPRLEVASRHRHHADLATRDIFGGRLETAAIFIDGGKQAGTLQFSCRRLTYIQAI